jgi:hypothetical protein
MPYEADAFDVTKPAGPAAAGYGPLELQAIKAVLVAWRDFVETAGPALVPQVATLNASMTDALDRIEKLEVSVVINEDVGVVNALKITVAPEDFIPDFVTVLVGEDNTSTAITLQINEETPIPVILNGGALPYIGSLPAGYIAEFWRNEALGAYVFNNPYVSPSEVVTEEFLYTDGTPQTWEIPVGVTSIEYYGQAPGGRGANFVENGSLSKGGAGGGAGATINGTLIVTPGSILTYTIATINSAITSNPIGVTFTIDGVTRAAQSGSAATIGTAGTMGIGSVPGTPGAVVGPTSGVAGQSGGAAVFPGVVGGKGGNSVFGVGALSNAVSTGWGSGGSGGRQGAPNGQPGRPGFLRIKYTT